MGSATTTTDVPVLLLRPAVKAVLVFAPTDHDLAVELDAHLAAPKRDGLIHIWHREMAAPGEEVEDAARRHLEEAELVLVLVSAALLASDLLYKKDLRRALRLHRAGRAKVIAIRARPVDLGTSAVARLPMLPLSGHPITSSVDRDVAWTAVASEIRRHVSALMWPQTEMMTQLQARPAHSRWRRMTAADAAIVSVLVTVLLSMLMIGWWVSTRATDQGAPEAVAAVEGSEGSVAKASRAHEERVERVVAEIESFGDVATPSVSNGGGQAPQSPYILVLRNWGRPMRYRLRFSREVTSPDVVPGTAEVRGSLDREIIRRIIRRHINEVKFCYEKELTWNPNLQGRIMIQFTIGPTGAVLTSIVQSSTMGNPAVEQCIAAAVRRWEFPKPRGGIVVVTYPFILKAVEG